MANQRTIDLTTLDASTHRCILLTLSRDDDAIVCKVRKHGPILLTADDDDAHKRLVALVLDPKVPAYKGDPEDSGIGQWFRELGRTVSELAPQAERSDAPPRPRKIAVMLTVDGPHLMIEAPPRLAMRLAPAQTFAKLRELVDDATIPDASADNFDVRRFFRGAGRAIGELSGEKDGAA